MAFKFITFALLVAAANAGVLQQQHVYQPSVLVQQPQLIQKVVQPVLTKQVEEYDHHPQYNFAYDIQDGLTGDSKNQQESRDGDVVHGQYSLNDPDGYRRTVDYTADPINGFNAVVSRQPLGVVKAVVAQPAVAVHHQPTIVSHQPTLVAHQPTLVSHQPTLVQHAPVVTVARNIHNIHGQQLLTQNIHGQQLLAPQYSQLGAHY